MHCIACGSKTENNFSIVYDTKASTKTRVCKTIFLYLSKNYFFKCVQGERLNVSLSQLDVDILKTYLNMCDVMMSPVFPFRFLLPPHYAIRSNLCGQ